MLCLSLCNYWTKSGCPVGGRTTPVSLRAETEWVMGPSSQWPLPLPSRYRLINYWQMTLMSVNESERRNGKEMRERVIREREKREIRERLIKMSAEVWKENRGGRGGVGFATSCFTQTVNGSRTQDTGKVSIPAEPSSVTVTQVTLRETWLSALLGSNATVN